MPRPYPRLRPTAPRLATALLTAVLTMVLPTGLAVVSSAPAVAAQTCPAFNVQQASMATVVFHGRVAGPPKQARTGQALVYPVAVQRPLKGPVTGQVQVRFGAGPCQPKRLTPDEDYFFFVDRSGAALIAGGATHGVQGYTDRLNAQLNQILGGAGASDGSEPPAVTFDPPSADRPSSFTRVAAPGAALVIVGVLGLLVVRRLGRRAT